MTKLLKGLCDHCGGQIEFPAEAAGTTAECPICGKPTELFLIAPSPEPFVPRKTIMLTIVAILILIGGLLAAMLAVRRAERIRDRQPTTTTSNPATPPYK